MQPELFHEIAQPDSARIRRFITENHIKVTFRNITYPEVMADLTARGGKNAPALWDGTTLIEGADAILRVLASLVRHEPQ